ncbi:hypothetical protein O1M54_18330 [Streptomyces diastatochromogenes]|nr:hypothetical protein [Streptomyces diastatochromogenes]
MGAALEVAEARFRELAARTATAQATAAELHQRYAPSAGSPVTGYVEQAKDRLVFATAQLNESRQAADTGDRRRAARSCARPRAVSPRPVCSSAGSSGSRRTCGRRPNWCRPR